MSLCVLACRLAQGSSEAETKGWLAALAAAGCAVSSAASKSSAAKPDAKARAKRAAVSAEAGTSAADDGAPFKKVSHPKSAEARAFIHSVVDSSALFAGATPAQREQLVDAMEERQASDGEMIIRQGDAGDHFFIVRTGEYAVLLKQKGDTPVHKYKPGGSFGELALLYNKPRAASIKCVQPGVVYALDRSTFRYVLMAGNR